MTFTGNIPDALPEYWRDIYGEATITWIPPVSVYNYPENVGIRTSLNGDFKWHDVTIPLDDVQDGCLLDFTIPDSYVLQITPDLGWNNILGMFGEDEDLELSNPHIHTFGPFIISAGTLISSVMLISKYCPILKSLILLDRRLQIVSTIFLLTFG